MSISTEKDNFPIYFKHLNRSLAISSGALAVVLLAACSKTEPPPPAPRPALAFTIAGGAGTDIDVYSGEIRARKEADHAFRVGGKIQKRLVDTGAVVKRGQALAQLDPQDVKLAADAARAQVSAQQTESEFADAELRRFRDLFQKGFVSQSALDRQINLANAARARLDAQRASANVSINQAGYATLVAETDGVVTQVMAEAGQVVAAGQAVMKIANPRERELSISVPEAKIRDFQGANVSRPIRVHIWSNPQKFYPGRIREVGGAADNVTRTYPVRVSLTEVDDTIGLGMTAFAAFVGSDGDGTFSVPLSAVYVKGESTGVWAIAADGKVSLKPVTVVQYRETTAVVKSTAVKAGDTIVAAGVHKLRDGEIVKPVKDAEVKGDNKVAMAPTPDATSVIAARSASR